MDTTMGTVFITNPNSPGEDPKSFTFDNVFDWTYVHTLNYVVLVIITFCYTA